MLYSIAVAKEHRGSGLGAKLLTHVEEQALATGHQIIYGVCEPASKGFYERSGYSVGALNEALTLQWGTRKAQFPISCQAHWFWKDLAGDNGRAFVLNPPRNEPAQTNEPTEHAAAPDAYEPSRFINGNESCTEANPGVWKRFWSWLTAQ